MTQELRIKNRKKSEGEGLPGSEFWHRNSLEANCWQSQMPKSTSGFPGSRFWRYNLPKANCGQKPTPKWTFGFTLIEMIVSVAIFSLVVVVSTGAVFTIIRTNQKVQTIKTVMENLNFALESMNRVIRFSTDYHCGNIGTLSLPRNCAYPNGDDFIA